VVVDPDTTHSLFPHTTAPHRRDRDAANMAHIYETGTRAWQPDPTDGWIGSELVDKKIEGDKVKLVFQCENGEVRT